MDDNGAPNSTHENELPKNFAQASTLPIELLISILELTLVSRSWSLRATQLSLVLLVNRTIYAGVAKSAYSTVILNSIKSVESFFWTIESSPHLAGLVVNLWIATPRLNGFDTSNCPARVIENKITTILSQAPGLKRVALPHEYIPRKGFSQVTHLSTSNDLFPLVIPVINSLEGLHIHGLPGRNCVNTIITRFPELRCLKVDVFSPSESDHPDVSLLCARMVLLFRQRLKRLADLKISANASVIKMLKTGLKNTLEEDPRLYLQEEPGGVIANRFLQDTWLVECG